MMCVTCHKRSRDLCAVGGGTRGCNPRKIEMFCDGMVECSYQKNTQPSTSCQDRQRAKDSVCLTSFSRRQKARQRKHRNKKQSAKKNVQSKTQNTQHRMRRSWQHTEQHTQCQRLQQARLTKKRAKLGLTDNQEQTACLTTGLLASKLSHNERKERKERKVRRIQNSKIGKCVCLCI